MIPGLTFTQLGTICLTLAAPDGRPTPTVLVELALRQPPARARDALAQAAQHGYVAAGDEDTWTLTERGSRLASALTRELERTSGEARRLQANPFTDYLPTGKEILD